MLSGDPADGLPEAAGGGIDVAPVQMGLLYRVPVVTVFSTSVFGVPLGIARAAIAMLGG
jgi:hypothetical protein